MGIESWNITHREEWLRRRKLDVTASVTAALLGLHPYVTPMMLFMDKAGRVPLDDTETPPMRRGKIVELLAAPLIKEIYPEWEVIQASDYIRDTIHRLGCTPDFHLRDGNNRTGICQFKSIEPRLFEKTWRDPETKEIVPPTWIGIQAALEKHLTGADFAVIGALRIGYALEFDLIPVPDTPGLIERIEGAADAFWESVAKGDPPPADHLVDAELVRLLYPNAKKDKTIDLTGNNRIAYLAEEDARLAGTEKDAGEKRRAIKSEVLELLGDAEFGLVNGEVVVTAKVVERKAEKVPRPASSFRKIVFRSAA